MAVIVFHTLYTYPWDPREILKLEHEALTQKSAMYGTRVKGHTNLLILQYSHILYLAKIQL